MKNQIVSEHNDKMKKAIQTFDKQERAEKIEELKNEIVETYENEYTDAPDYESVIKDVKAIIDGMEKDEVRRLITEENMRPDGRKVDEIRSLDSDR